MGSSGSGLTLSQLSLRVRRRVLKGLARTTIEFMKIKVNRMSSCENSGSSSVISWMARATLFSPIVISVPDAVAVRSHVACSTAITANECSLPLKLTSNRTCSVQKKTERPAPKIRSIVKSPITPATGPMTYLAQRCSEQQIWHGGQRMAVRDEADLVKRAIHEPRGWPLRLHTDNLASRFRVLGLGFFGAAMSRTWRPYL